MSIKKDAPAVQAESTLNPLKEYHTLYIMSMKEEIE